MYKMLKYHNLQHFCNGFNIFLMPVTNVQHLQNVGFHMKNLLILVLRWFRSLLPGLSYAYTYHSLSTSNI